MTARNAVAGFGKFTFDASADEGAAVEEQLPVAPEQPVERSKAIRPPSRRGKRNVNFVLSEEAWEQLSILSVRTRRPIQALMTEATDLLFQANNLSRIAKG
jgi:hypothetical protein